MLELATLGAISDSALTRDAEFQMTAAGLPNTFVPGRNLLFFTYAAALAYRRGIRTLVGGMCETDYSGYPDCRNDTLQALAKAISLGMDAPFAIETPLMWIDKAATWAMARAARRRGAGRPHRRAHAHVLHRRPYDPPRLGLRLRRNVRPAACARGDGKMASMR